MISIRHKDLVVAVGVGLSTFVLIIIAMIPLYQNMRMTGEKIKVKSNELEQLNRKVSVLAGLDTNVLQERVSVLDRALPPRKDIILYLNSISALSQELGLQFGGLSLAPGNLSEATSSGTKANEADGVQKLATEIKMTGDRDSIYSFLRTIESILPLMQIGDIKVEVEGENRYSLNLTLEMLWAQPTTIDVKGPISLFGSEENKYFEQLSQYRWFENFQIPQNNELGQKQDIFAPVEVTPLP